MKTSAIIIAAAFTCFSLSACGKKDTEEVKDKVGDALNTRPNEKLRDASEDLQKDVKDASKDAGDAVKELGKEIKEDVKDATKSAVALMPEVS